MYYKLIFVYFKRNKCYIEYTVYAGGEYNGRL